LVNGNYITETTIVTLEELDNSEIEFFTDLTSGRDLMPTKITWKDSKGRTWNIFDTEAVRASFTKTAVVTDTLGIEHNILVPKEWSTTDINHMLQVMYPNNTLKTVIAPVVDKVKIQATFDNLHRGFFINENGERENITDL